MRLLTFVICCVSMMVCASDKASMTPEQRAQKRAEMYRRTGGRVVLPPKGFVALVDCQSRADFAKAFDRFERVFNGLGLKSQGSRQATPFTLSELTTKTKELGAGSVVFLVDDPILPMSIVAIESRSGLVNVAALATDNPTPALLSRRVAKMACRVAVIASGGSESEAPTSMMNTVCTLKDLDSCEGLGNDANVMMGVIRGMFKVGVTTERMMTYRQACLIGEAMMPTNEVQKAIWEDIHALPANPIKIKPETKKVAE